MGRWDWDDDDLPKQVGTMGLAADEPAIAAAAEDNLHSASGLSTQNPCDSEVMAAGAQAAGQLKANPSVPSDEGMTQTLGRVKASPSGPFDEVLLGTQAGGYAKLGAHLGEVMPGAVGKPVLPVATRQEQCEPFRRLGSPPLVSGSSAHASPLSAKLTDLGKLKKLLGKTDNNSIQGKDVISFLNASGLLDDDPRIRKDVEKLKCWDQLSERHAGILLGHNLIKKALCGNLAIKDFPAFKALFKEMYDAVAPNTGGNVADYIPKLANQSPHCWAASVCSTDGQRCSLGDADVTFSAQSSSKPITYGLALETKGEHIVHQHVGKEPSGRNFNARLMLERGNGRGAIPHNPYINAGAIMSASLVKMEDNEWERFEYMLGIWERLCGGAAIGFQYDTFCGERATASRNFCLAHMMEEEKAFPSGTDLKTTLEAYFSWCSIELTCRSMSVLAATLANGGVCPTTLERIFTHETVTHMLSIMMSCGMYDFSGRFAYEVGFPAKSGVSGVICIVIPGVCGMATFSPRLDSLGNSVRGIDFCRRVSSRLPYHMLGRLRGLVNEAGLNRRGSAMSTVGTQESPKFASAGHGGSEQERQQLAMRLLEKDEDEMSSLLWSAERGDCQRIRQLAVRGVDINIADYDKRTALHVAASEGQNSAVKLLLELSADMQAQDIHGGTPLDDATREHQNHAKRTLQRAACTISLKSPANFRKKHDWSCDLMKYFAGLSVQDQKQGGELLPRNVLIDTLGAYGFNVEEDSRLAFLESLPDALNHENLNICSQKLPLLSRALRGELAIPNFCSFCDKFEELFAAMCVEGSEHYLDGDETFDLMTVDGQRLHLGRTKQSVTLDELSSVVVFLVTVECCEGKSISTLVGNEPSGESNSENTENADGIPYNPFMWNGMLALLALLEQHFENVWTAITEMWSGLSGQSAENMQHDDEWETKDRENNYHHVSALIHTLIAQETLPQSTEVDVVVSHFFRLRSLVASNQELASMSALFANGGVNIFNGDRIVRAQTVKDLLTLMFTTGCGAMSGEFSFRLGVPAKSSAVGVLLMVVPNLAGMCSFGVQVNSFGVSLAALKLCFDIGDEFNFHGLAGNCTKSAKLDPSLYHFQTDIELCDNLLWAASKGDLSTLVYLRNLGFNLNNMDYDMRSAAHLAAGAGQIKALRYLHKNSADMEVTDRWGNSPLDDAERNSHEEVARLLRKWSTSSNASMSAPSEAASMMSCKSGAGSKVQKSDRSGAPCAATESKGRHSRASVFNLDSVFEDGGDDEDDNDEDPDAPGKDKRSGSMGAIQEDENDAADSE